MTSIKNIKIKNFTYDLPDEKIAKFPLPVRDQSKLLIYRDTKISEDVFTNLDNYLDRETLLLFNNTKVIPARLFFKKETGAEIEIFCLEPFTGLDYQGIENIKDDFRTSRWECMIGNLKRWKEPTIFKQIETENENFILTAKNCGELSGGNFLVEFSWNQTNLNFYGVLQLAGLMPIPPYLNRRPEESDSQRYQTIYSQIKGSVAAPTAGLHFTENVIEKIKTKKIEIDEITLHVGAGTFKPVKTDTIGDHEMHSEYFFISQKVLTKIIERRNKIIPVGTTSLRTLESLYWLGVKILANQFDIKKPHIAQWDAYELPQNVGTEIALLALLNFLINNNLDVLCASTQILIVPGYDFKLTAALVTNFHQPQSTLLLLIAALIGQNWKEVYNYALQNSIRFLSYGDSSILFRQ